MNLFAMGVCSTGNCKVFNTVVIQDSDITHISTDWLILMFFKTVVSIYKVIYCQIICGDIHD